MGMAHWNHRVVKSLENGQDWYTIREVFYNHDGSIFAYTEEPVDVSGETIEELRQSLGWMIECLALPVLIDGEVEFVDREEE